MARIESVAKAGYYPTPNRVTDLLSQRLRRHTRSSRARLHGFRILDPCCGNGEAINNIAEDAKELKLQPTTYGIELNRARASSARTILDNVLHSDFFHTTIAHNSFDLVWLNPPYDIESSTLDSRRVETTYLKRCVRYLKPNTGILVYIIPQIALPDGAQTLSRDFTNIHCLNFPEPERSNFGQIIVTAKRKDHSNPDPDTTNWLRDIGYADETLPSLDDPPNDWELRIPRQTHEPAEVLFASQNIDVALALTEAAAKGIFSTPTVRERFWPTNKLTTRPILPLRQGHIALMTAAGFLDNQVLPGSGDADSLIIKGRTHKESITTQQSETSLTETEVMRTTIRSLNLRTGHRRTIQP